MCKNATKSKLVFPTEPEMRGVNRVDWSRMKVVGGRHCVWVECGECADKHGRWVCRYRVNDGRCAIASKAKRSGKFLWKNFNSINQLWAYGDTVSEGGSNVFLTRAYNHNGSVIIPFQCVCGVQGHRFSEHNRSAVSQLFLCQSCARSYPFWIENKDLRIEGLLERAVRKGEYMMISITRNHPYSEMATFVKQSSSPFSQGRVTAHRYVMAWHLGRALTAKEVVHHRDGLGTHNILANLELMEAHQHTLETRVETVVRQEMRTKIQELESKIQELKAEVRMFQVQLQHTCACQLL